jgi:selenoprotein W-related protein
MTQIQIEYCVACGFLGRAEEVQHALLTGLGQRAGGVLMKPGRGGVFQVSVDGELIFDKSRDGFDVAEIVRRAAARCGTAGEPLGAPPSRPRAGR